ncbi:MAG: RnfABCDGE type electron transport complex subunit G, partial [Bacteroidales bacterium]|nr:RnfABCDGE type electron transport complex subunit G [Bacteroidales bacterium]
VPSDEVFTKELNGVGYKVYPARKGDQTVGYAIESFSNAGFGGRISLMVGFDSEGNIVNVSVISHSETPGLGAKIVDGKSNFSVQFKGKNPVDFKLSVRKDGGDVDAITASTITSRAYCGALESAYKIFLMCRENQEKKEVTNEQ